jgi:hypothetical protein
MKKFIIISLLVGFIACSPKTYTFRGKQVTKKQFDRKLDRHTKRFIRKNTEFVKLWQGVEVVYDTIQN